ncbi:MAG: type II secretion system major pseudopilin GspG [Candidatus Omnitrophica bacterium]|nr:type II secretion system major pseudopilin GspG [Candidatus Omnitrophota bacterium]
MKIKNTKAFTLIEIMLVVIIIGVLAAMIVPNLVGRGEQARLAAARADIDGNLVTALDLYEIDNGKYPTTGQGLPALSMKPSDGSDKWRGPYLKKKSLPLDPWGKAYVYVCPGVHNLENYDLSSLGPDGIESADDVTNWGESKK